MCCLLFQNTRLDCLLIGSCFLVPFCLFAFLISDFWFCFHGKKQPPTIGHGKNPNKEKCTKKNPFSLFAMSAIVLSSGFSSKKKQQMTKHCQNVASISGPRLTQYLSMAMPADFHCEKSLTVLKLRAQNCEKVLAQNFRPLNRA